MISGTFMSLDCLLAERDRVKILLLTKYGSLGASSRMRTLQYIPWLENTGFDVEQQSLLSDEMLAKRYRNGKYGLTLLKSYLLRCKALYSRKNFDIVWIEKEALPWWPVWIELSFLQGTPYVLDYDDAIFHNYDLHRRSFIRYLFGQRLDGLMRKSLMVSAGNGYLAQRALDAGSKRVEIIPTVVDLDRYHVTLISKASNSDGLPRVVWIGSPSTVHYLRMLEKPLLALSLRIPFVLRVIGGGDVVKLP